jgi:hypothetical protein
MAIIRLKTRVSANSGVAIVNAASVASTVDQYYDTNNIVWPTLAAASGSLIQSVFEYALPSGVLGQVYVNNTVGNIASSASASIIP